MISLPLKPKIKKVDDNKSVFEIEALYPGYGVTIGNSLRRVLLSSLEGAAITRVKIEGVPHEFSTISGVLEDVIIILLNLKKIRFKLHSDEPQQATLKVKGKKVVKASDFKLPPQIEIINKNAVIATLTSQKSSLEMEIQVEKGIGYQPVEMRKKEKLEIGVIPLDAIYTPIKNVAFRVENMRVGERTDFDKLILEIETDGILTPEDAFLKASQTLIEHFSIFSRTDKKKETKKEKPVKKRIRQLAESWSKAGLEDLKISAKTVNILNENKIKSVAGLLRKSEKDLLEIKGMGDKATAEIKKALKKEKLSLKE